VAKRDGRSFEVKVRKMGGMNERDGKNLAVARGEALAAHLKESGRGAW
jgi:hypothetical protein